MSEENKKQLNLSLLLPAGLLLLEIIVILVMLATGYEITGFLLSFFILLAFFLIYQIARQQINNWQIKQAVKKIGQGKALADSNQPMQAIKLWKELLLKIPREKYLIVLEMMEETYQEQDMNEAVQQVKAIRSESVEFFEMTQGIERFTRRDQRKWKARAFELRKMIKALPEEKDQNLSDMNLTN